MLGILVSRKVEQVHAKVYMLMCTKMNSKKNIYIFGNNMHMDLPFKG